MIELAFLGGRERLARTTCTASSSTTPSDRPACATQPLARRRPRGAVWTAGVPIPSRLPRWWPGRRRAWRTLARRLDRGARPRPKGKARAGRLHAARGRGSRAGSRGARRSRSRRSSASCPSRPPRSSWSPTSEGTRVRLALRPAPARLGALRPVPDPVGRRAGRCEGALDGLAAARRGWRSRLMRWWGWGEDGHDVAAARGGGGPAAGRSSAWSRVASARRSRWRRSTPCRRPRLPSARAARRPSDAVGAEHVRDDRAPRVAHAAGRSYPDLVRLRSGDALERARRRGAARRPPTQVARRAGGVRRGAAWRWCRSAAARAWWAGWSRCARASQRAISLDLRALDRARSTSTRSRSPPRSSRACSARELERRLAAQGLTLGHFPQSFEYSTVGGWVATRSAGQASTGYGRIDELVEARALRDARPASSTRADVPATAAGPSCASWWWARRACWA